MSPLEAAAKKCAVPKLYSKKCIVTWSTSRHVPLTSVYIKCSRPLVAMAATAHWVTASKTKWIGWSVLAVHNFNAWYKLSFFFLFKFKNCLYIRPRGMWLDSQISQVSKTLPQYSSACIEYFFVLFFSFLFSFLCTIKCTSGDLPYVRSYQSIVCCFQGLYWQVFVLCARFVLKQEVAWGQCYVQMVAHCREIHKTK